jgi:hypothetical protein
VLHLLSISFVFKKKQNDMWRKRLRCASDFQNSFRRGGSIFIRHSM